MTQTNYQRAVVIENDPDLFDILTEFPGLILEAELALDSGIFDEGAREEASLTLASAKRLYAELLSQAYPQSIESCSNLER